LDAVPEGKEDISWLREVPGMTAEPSTAADVSKIFLKRVSWSHHCAARMSPVS
jgi:hypothetical protein